MGKSEPTSQRFRRKTKASGSTEQPTNPLVSPSDGADNLLCENLLDSADLDVSSPEQTQGVPQDLTATNGSCNPEEELADTDTKGVNTPIMRDERVTAEPPPHKDPDRSKYLCLTSHLPAELSALSRSKITPLCSNQSLDVSACHLQKEDSVVLVVFVSNCSDSFLQQIRLQVNSEELEVSCVCDCPSEELNSHSVAVCQYFLSVRRPSAHFDLSAAVSWQLPAGSAQTAQFSYKLPLTSFIRALSLSTEEYGAMWLDYSHDTKQNLTLLDDDQDPLTATLDKLKRKIQLHVVEILGKAGFL
ncbi:hypothetical protein CHARACLAT_032870, partial [Characodon lateralis]|nr:hypothetical protein [Characodon lateralis]